MQTHVFVVKDAVKNSPRNVSGARPAMRAE